MKNFIHHNFIEHNKNLFNSYKKKKTKKKIYIEFNKWACNHITISNCLYSLKKEKDYFTVAYPENGFQYFFKKKTLFNSSKFYLGNKLGIKNFGIYKSFSTDVFLNIKNEKNYKIRGEKIFKKLAKNIRTKNDIFNLKLKKIPVGDLIYDSYLKQFNAKTINIKSEIFIEFLKKSIEYFLFWYDEFKNNNIEAVISSQSVYLSSLPIRIGVFFNVLCLVANPERLYKLNKKHIFSDKEFLFFEKKKKNIKSNLLKRGLGISEKRLKSRFHGKVGVDLSYLSETAYGKFKNKKIVENKKRFNVLIAPHSFSDAPHQLGKHIFPDYYEWLKFVLDNANFEKFDWYIKCHPNFVEYFDNTVEIIKNLKKKYKFLRYVEPSISHNQLIKEGIDAVITCHGSIGAEYPFFNKLVLNASTSNPHINYNFNIHPKNSNQLKKNLLNLNKIKFKIKKKEILEYYFFKNIFFSNNWIFENVENFIKFCGGYKNIYTYRSYDYWLKNWTIKKQEILSTAISKFINSKDYMMTFEHYNKNLEDHLDENFI